MSFLERLTKLARYIDKRKCAHDYREAKHGYKPRCKKCGFTNGD